MAFAEWLVPLMSLERQIDVERHARSVLTEGTEEQIRDLCSQLIRTLAEREQIMLQAVEYLSLIHI